MEGENTQIEYLSSPKLAVSVPVSGAATESFVLLGAALGFRTWSAHFRWCCCIRRHPLFVVRILSSFIFLGSDKEESEREGAKHL